METETEQSYTKETMQELIRRMSKLFDVVRLVDPVAMIVYDIEDGEFKQQRYSCFHVWKKDSRCENCISARSYMIKERCSKFEFIGDESYHVVAQTVRVDGRDFVLEVVTKSNDNVMLSAFGKSEFADFVNQFNHKVYTDALTGISNRRFIDERYPILVNFAYAEKSSLATIMLDVDGFKQINDTLGHQKGDEVLKYIADTLRSHFPPKEEVMVARYCGDIVARYGGDEFFVAARDISLEELRQRIEAFQKEIGKDGYALTASAGAYYQANVSDLDYCAMIARADEALYESKHHSKGSFTIVE